ncbi:MULTISPECIES: nuclear transport factor 2 family protein [unclassified Mesorhizobium]|uniref:nuclear transport factor 2 family protein n=1 Tax=unclassified Mesorhizobium TaxID=325217 RepID=UPI000FCBBF83|nr:MULTISPECIES: nuclear transport factor 2 family protein [unclassified Mesorhizobium]RUW45532.1 nuclear transport factor 2 family protein [Mesorhizobium sp. M8A.F.Ca.ET.021.01.1.1]TGP95478.1 nuclear transport factor 2 family protein [Mesorhizobium sp. M8A.F.Ca.ET.218.01.1.1]TGT18534.1 nuclear transport factor 2 family protein [Mesorhizobium sp. M8A.F.Ca.ET.213.01.1.1]
MSQTDERQINAVVESYVLAMSTADQEKLRTAFHASASIIGNYQGAVEWLSVDGYVGEVMGADLAPNNSPNWKILLLDITADAATVKVEDEFGSMKFTDYLSLLKVAGEWRIVSKIYHLHT